MYCNRLHAWWSTQSLLATVLSSLIARQWVGLQTLWWFRLKDWSIDEMVGDWCFGCLSGPSGSTCWNYYPPTKSEGYSFGVVRASIRSVRPSFHPSVRTFCLSGTISQYLLVRFNSFLVQIISTMDSWYPISLVKIDPLTLELLPLFKYRQL